MFFSFYSFAIRAFFTRSILALFLGIAFFSVSQARAQDGIISQNTIDTLLLDEIALRVPGEPHAFPIDAWRESPRDIITELMLRIKPNGPFIELKRSLFLSTMLPPLGSYDESLPSLFDLRLWMMAQMKSVDELKALFARIPPFAVTPRHRLFYVSGLLIARKDTEACDYVSKEMLEDVTSIWPLVRIYCTAISGDLAQAKLLVQLFTEQSNQPVPQSLRDFILALSLKKGLPEAEKAWISYVQKEALLLSIAKSDLPAIVNSSGVIPTALSVRWKKDLSDLASRDIVAYVQDLAFYRAALWLHKDAMPPREQYDLLFYVFDHDITLSLAMIEPLMDSFRKSPAEAMLVCLNGFDRSLTPAAARYCSAKAKDLGFILQSRVMTAAYVLHETRPTDK